MATAKYSDLLDDVLPSLQADPSDPVTEYAIKRAVIDFCAGSWVWKHLADPVTVTAGEAAYDLEAPPGSDVTTVMSASLDGVPLTPKTLDWLEANEPRWRTETAVPKFYTQVDTEQIILARVPDSTYTESLLLTLALQPSKSSTGFPRWIMTQHMYALADGAIANLMLMADKPWTNLNVGADKRAKFEAAMFNARASAVAALGRAATRTTSQH